jgi:hypothetical protein
MEKDLIAYLLAHTAVAAQVSARINWVRAPQAVARPNVILHRVSGERDTTNDGPSGFVSSRIQVDCFGARFEDAKAAAVAIETALSGRSFSQGSTQFQGCFLEAERTGEEDTDSPDKVLRVSLDFIIFHGGL